MDISKVNKVHFVGIGGIGMSALAQLFSHWQKQVSGSDREVSPVIDLLVSRGVKVTIGHDTRSLPADADLVVYSDAVPKDNVERAWARYHHVPELSYFQVLGLLSKVRRTIAVAGTHGKTTTTAMLASMLKSAGKEPTAIVGSIVQEFGSNFLAGTSDLLVVEACEYRDHLLELSPEILVITNIEWDHTDYFPSLDAVQKTFKAAASHVPGIGAVVANTKEDSSAAALEKISARMINYAIERVPPLLVPGEFNVMNARAAKAAAKAAFPDVADTVWDASLRSYRGTWRRFEYKGKTPRGALVYDDYAHHPTAIRKTIEAAREKFPDKKIIIVFHPHLYSRTKSLLDEFAAALAMADHAIVAPIYAAREAIDPTVSSDLLARRAKDLGGTVESLGSFEEIRDRLLLEDSNSLIITMGAGDIYKVAGQIAK